MLQQNWSRNEKSLREVGELVWKERAYADLENNVFNFYLNREIQPTENNNVNNNVTAENSSVQQSEMARRAVRS